MTYSNYINNIKDTISTYFPDDYEIRVDKVIKNNGLNLDALVIMSPQSNIYPTIYLNDFYNPDNQDTKRDVERILNIYHTHRIDSHVDISELYVFDKIKHRIIYRLVSRDKNSKLLETIPWRPYSDLAITYHILVDCRDNFCGTIAIKNDNLDLWKTTESILHSLAKENTKKLLSPDVTSMVDFINSISDEKLIDTRDATDMMYVLTNKQRAHGAACLLYPDLLKSVADRYQRDIFILPSSIHEVMLLADDGKLQLDMLSNMVREINLSQVDISERLSDHAYLYLRREDRIIY